LRESVFGQDADFRRDNLIARYNADLANNLGNFASRVLAMQDKYFGGLVQPLGSSWPPEDAELRDQVRRADFDAGQFTEDLQFHRALERIWSALDHANRYVVQTAPFTMIKDPNQKQRVGEVLHHLLEVVRALARVLAPFMPDTSEELRRLLAVDISRLGVEWGKAFAPGHKVNPAKNLFPRIEPVKK
jgi:methionyl-tRNA synthetase